MMENSRNYAVRIEYIMRGVFECDRCGMGGLVDSDYIRKYPFTAMMTTIMFLCERDNGGSVDIASAFFKRFQYYGEWNIDELLSFENDTKEIDGRNYEIEYTNGAEALKSMIEAFHEVCNKLM